MAIKKATVAKVLALAKKDGPSFVIASEEPKYTQVEMAAFNCKTCKVPFRANAGTMPFCVTCGSDDVISEEIPADDEFELPEGDEDLAAIQCASCGMHNLITNKLVSAFAGNMNCVTCGEDIEFMAGDGSDVIETDDIVGDAEGEDDLLAVEDIVEETEDDSAGTDLVDDTEEEAEFEGDVDGDGDIDAEDFEEVEETEGFETDSAGNESATVKLLTVAGKGDLTFELAGSKLTAYIGKTPVATLSKEVAGENAGVMHSTSFAQAVKHTAKQLGVDRALAHYGFKPIYVKLPVKKFVDDKAEAKIKAERAKLESQSKSMRAELMQGLQIAAAGLNKRFWKNKDNAIKASLFDELSALNVRNPAKMIDKVFAAKSDEYHTALFELATEILAKPVEVRNQIAEAIGIANYQAAEIDDVEVDELDENSDVSVEETLESAGVRRTVTASNKSKTAPQFIASSVAEVRSLNGGRLFS